MAGVLAGIKNVMQIEIFQPSEERLLTVISVTKSTGRKKRPSFLTLSVPQHGSHPIVLLSRVKAMDKKESLNAYKRVKTWSLLDLKLVDCHSEGPELDFKFEKQIFKWIALNIAEKKSFIVNLFKMADKYHGKRNIKFINVDEAKLQDLLHSSSAESKVVCLEDSEETLEQEEYRELSSQEETDLEDLLKSGRENAIQDAVAFMENLSEELSQLDQSNIHSLMGSEEQIEQLMEYLGGGVMEIEKMEMRLTVYDELLAGVRETMQKLSFQYSHILRQNTNLKSLCDEVDELVTKLDLNPRVEMVLQECPLGTRRNVEDSVTAAQTLQKALSQELSQGLSILQSVTDQRAFFSNLSSAFGKRLQEYLTAQFLHNATIITESIHVRHTSSPTLASHSPVHTNLLVYQELTKWLKECQPEIFSEVMDAYIRAFRHVYEEQLKGLLKDSRDMLQLVRNSDVKRPGGYILSKISGSTADIRSPIGGSLSSLSPARGNAFVSQSIADFGVSPSLSQDSSRGPTFEKIFPLILEQIQPVCVAEQKFLNSFFHFERIERVSDEREIVESDMFCADEADGLRRMQDVSEDIISCGNMGSQNLLNQLFAALLPELEEFIDFGERQDSYNSLYLLVFVSQRLIFSEESGGTVSYLDETLKKALLHIMRLFDRLIDEKSKLISDIKFPRGNKCGILPCVRVFEDFAERAERIVMAADRRTELDKAYQFLIETLFRTVERVALDHPKTPHDVIQFENYNKIVDILSRLKIICLEKSRDEARKKYRSHKRDYVNNCLGRPLDKLSAFFDGIEKLRASGTKAEEVGFRLEYSKTELKKCIKEYPGKEVKRGLERLYRRVEKEVSEGELQVVWGNMQRAFIDQGVRFQDLIEECYPGSNLTLDFSVEDLTEYFTSISRSV